MDLFKWTKNLKPKFPNAIEKFFGRKIDEQAATTEEGERPVSDHIL